MNYVYGIAKILAYPILFLIVAPFTIGQSQFQVLHAFGSGTDGSGLWSAVTLDRKGNVYGTTSGGGLYGYGTVFQLSTTGNGSWEESILHNFPEYSFDGASPSGTPVLTADGSLLGPTSEGGMSNYGTIFELSPSLSGWTETVVYTFDPPRCCSVLNAHNPTSGLAQDNSGNLYGLGGSGIAFELTPGSGIWSYRTICVVSECAKTGTAAIAITPSGQLYGESEAGVYKQGSVYVLSKSQAGWHEYDLYDFGSHSGDGSGVTSGTMAYDGRGSLYGATFSGGTNNCGQGGKNDCGTIYKLSRQHDGQWKETILYNFEPGASGYGPTGGVILDKAGNLYGTAGYGGGLCSCGTVFRLSPNTNSMWTYTILHTFDGSDGALPASNLAMDPQGNLYGTTVGSGPNGGGVVFEITPQ